MAITEGSNGHSTATAKSEPKRTGIVSSAQATPWDYSPAPETSKVTIKPSYGLFIDGKFAEPKGAKRFATINPSTEATLSEVVQATPADVNRAVGAARAALPKWAGLPASERAKFIFRIARRIQERGRELAIIETLDSGKPIKESRDVDIPLVAAHFFYNAGWADKLGFVFQGKASRHRGIKASREELPEIAPGVHPVGVCGQVIPWNFPLLMAAWKIAPALACGNTVVLKPAETTPLTALVLAEICEECELPPGVVNIVTGDGVTGRAIVEHPDVDKIAFTGSTEVGKIIAKSVANPRPDGKFKRLTLELGGKSPHIIFEDAAIDQAVEGIINGIYFNQGEVCCAGSRLFVQESILDTVVKKLEIRLASLRTGDPMDKNTDVGAVNSKEQLSRIEHYLKLGQTEGAELRMPGYSGEVSPSNTGSKHGLPSKGFWCRPCFFTGVQPSHTIAREEIFGPVLSVLSFRTPEEAVSRANNTPYGLAAGIWTEKGSKMLSIAKQIKSGVVWCNTYNKFDPASPFGGFKESGFGREGGVQGLKAYVEI
ncbi:MAG: aldehyde dehydrogenase family protein [Phycisphaerae bacterium]|nr:aldehyde dehydrogenase family protein [Phycisphaerae bacterium]